MPIKIHDISPLISDAIAVFPGDQKFARQVVMDFEKNDHLMLSSIQTTVHLGAHTDAPNHYHASGVGIHQRDLKYYFGECQVVHVRVAPGARIQVSDLMTKSIFSKRVLFQTRSFPNPEKWNDDFASLSPELIHFLAAKGVVLVGIDTPSIDPADDKVLESHNAIFQNDMAILEGIMLDAIGEGQYLLSALPLKLLDADASPVRAVLIEGNLEDLWSK